MPQRGVIDVERHFADHSEGVLAIFEIVDPHVLRDEAADRIDGEPRDRSFDASFVELLRNAIPPFLTESPFGEIPARPAEDENERDDRQTQNAARLGVMDPRAAAIELAGEGWGRGFQDWRRHAGKTSNVQRPTSNAQ